MEDNTAKWWNRFLTVVSIFNIILVINYYYLNKNIMNNNKILILILVFLFVAVCAIRSIWPRTDSYKLCFYNNSISIPVVGRILATFAEMSFVTLLVIITNIILDDSTDGSILFSILKKYNYLLIPMIFCAQIFCWIGVTTIRPIFNAIEESLWAVLGSSKIIIFSLIYYNLINRTNLTPKINHIKFISPIIIVSCLFYVLFMVKHDIPMYIKRYRENKDEPLNFIDGIKELSRCNKISQSYSDWKEEIPWLTLYFTFAVWFVIIILYWLDYYKTL